MNKQRRKKLRELADQLSAIKEELESVKDDEQAAFDNLPDGLQQAEKGQAMEAAAAIIDGAIDDLFGVINALDEAQE